MKHEMPALALGGRPDLRADVTTGALKRWNPALAAAVTDEAATISIMDPIGADMFGEGVTSKRIAAALRRIGPNPVTVTINSPGGDVFEGAAIYELLRQHARDGNAVKVQIMGLAASAASLIAMAGTEIEIGQSSFVMIHNSWVMAMGDRNALAEAAEWLAPFDAAMRDVYVARTGKSADEITKMMDVESWFSASAAIAAGFADRSLDAGAVITGEGMTDAAAASLRAEKKFDLIAARAGITRKDARDLLHAVKGGALEAAPTDQPGAVDLEASLQAMLADLKPKQETKK